MTDCHAIDESGVAVCLRSTKHSLVRLLDHIQNFVGDERALARLQGMVIAQENKRVCGNFVCAGDPKVPAGQAILSDLLNTCYDALAEQREILLKRDSEISEMLIPIQKELVSIHRQLHAAKVAPHLLPRAQGRLHKLDSRRFSFMGIFGRGEPVYCGQAVLASLVEEAYELARDVARRQALKDSANFRRKSLDVDPTLLPIFRELQHVYSEIDNYHGDGQGLVRLQGRIVAVDRQRVGGCFGVFKKADGQLVIPSGQTLLDELVHACYTKVHCQLSSMEAHSNRIDSRLRPYYREVQSLTKGLHEAKMKPEKLPHIQGRLQNLDAHCRGGMFVPAHCQCDPTNLRGQGTLMEALHEAFAIARRVAVEH